MASLPRPEVPNTYTTIRSLKWSSAEKVIARKAFEHALHKDLEAIIRQAKKMAGRIEHRSDLWELERYLTERRKEIDRQYDYRYSVLISVFADLIQKGRLREQDLQGLSEEKLRHIRQMAQDWRPSEL
jgi:Photoprotection regulator fluorescence recovery protein